MGRQISKSAVAASAASVLLFTAAQAGAAERFYDEEQFTIVMALPAAKPEPPRRMCAPSAAPALR